MWNLPYIVARFKPEYTQARRDQVTVETIIALHRAREETFQDNRAFYIIHNPEDQEEIIIGFVETGLQESIFKWLDPSAIKVSDEIMDIVRGVLT